MAIPPDIPPSNIIQNSIELKAKPHQAKPPDFISQRHKRKDTLTNMSSHKRGATIIGSNFTTQASKNANSQTTPKPPPLCDSKICTVKAPHIAKAYTNTTTDLPKIIKAIDSKTSKTKGDIGLLDIFYTVHWDHINRPLPPRIKECVDKGCPVHARHEAKVFSKNAKKASLLPLKVQQVQAKDVKSRGEAQGLADFWRIHGPREERGDGDFS